MVMALPGYSVCRAARMFIGCKVGVGVAVWVGVGVAVALGAGVTVAEGVRVSCEVELDRMREAVGGGWMVSFSAVFSIRLQPPATKVKTNPRKNAMRVLEAPKENDSRIMPTILPYPFGMG